MKLGFSLPPLNNSGDELLEVYMNVCRIVHCTTLKCCYMTSSYINLLADVLLSPKLPGYDYLVLFLPSSFYTFP